MNKLKMIGVALLLALGLASCGQVVEVPIAHVGKKMTAQGIQEGIIEPSKFKLSWCVYQCDSLIILETSDFQVKESLNVFMPKDQLAIDIDIRGILSISTSLKNVNVAFSRLVATESNKPDTKIITSEAVYLIYGRNLIRKIAREVITEYTISELMINRKKVSTDINEEVALVFGTTPLSVGNISLARIKLPNVILEAEINRKKMEVAIKSAKAKKLVDLEKADAALEIAKRQQLIDLLEAETQVLVEKKLAESVSKAFVTQRSLKVLMEMAKSQNKVFIVPSEAFNNPAMMVGINNQAIKGSK